MIVARTVACSTASCLRTVTVQNTPDGGMYAPTLTHGQTRSATHDENVYDDVIRLSSLHQAINALLNGSERSNGDNHIFDLHEYAD
jgi:hypothetical protein